MLTVEDVCDWVVHSLHMPEEIADILRSNAVTGYDFPDLVEHDGRLIETELGIAKRTLKSRLYRGIVMRLMGMGTLPYDVLTVQADSASCKEIRLEWTVEQRERHGFPTHKYLVQRFEPSAGSISDATPNDSTPIQEILLGEHVHIDTVGFKKSPVATPGQAAVSDWVAVCSDMATFCIDKGLEPGKKYKYRISAWNAVRKLILSLQTFICCLLYI